MNEPETKTLLHVGLTVTDMAASVKFYRDVVAMTVKSEFVGRNDWFDELTDNPGAELSVTHMRLGSYELQLIEYLAAGLSEPAQLAHNRVGSPHMCFLVTDVDAKFAEVSARGDVTITSGVIDIAAGARSFYVNDPDGVPVEFVQIPRRWTSRVPTATSPDLRSGTGSRSRR
ncbi:MAG: VOC family protein [Actinomycetota bacterium]|jgi:catechol 2,3-dioxygenase-like lactoylglutathione lyase family enzyme|nr:VOC family protein [Actinomycetota bacterium]